MCLINRHLVWKKYFIFINVYSTCWGIRPFYTAVCIKVQLAYTWAYLQKLLWQTHTDRKQMSLN